MKHKRNNLKHFPVMRFFNRPSGNVTHFTDVHVCVDTADMVDT